MEDRSDGILVAQMDDVKMTRKKILITGAAGFIGFHLWNNMKAEYDIVVVDNITDFSNYEIKKLRLKKAGLKKTSLDENEVTEVTGGGLFIKADVRDLQKLNKIFEAHDFDLVIHLAALTGVRQSLSDPHIYHQNNVVGTRNIFEACKNSGVTKIIFASSSSVYGGISEVPFREEMTLPEPLSPYGKTKQINEREAQHFALDYSANVVALRFFTVYGPWSRPDMATFKFMEAISNNNKIQLFNSGEMMRDFTYVDDIVESIFRVSQKLIADSELKKYRVFNVGGSNPVDLKFFVSILNGLFNKKNNFELLPMQQGEMLKTFADNTLLNEFINYRPSVTVQEGLRKTVEWYREEYLSLNGRK